MTAVDGVTLEVGQGEICALLGLNGEDRTTLMRILLGMVRPGGGSVTLLGRDVGDRAVRAEIDYLVETASAYPEVTVRKNLEVARCLRGVPPRAAVEDAVELFGLREHADRRARGLSLGNLRRLALARATLHRPALLVLDEPVNGLDPAGVVEVRLLLGRLAREHGTTVLLSSHILGEVARVATRIGILHRGGRLDEFGAAEPAERVGRRLEVTTRDDAGAASVLRSAGLAVHERRGTLVLAHAAVVDRPEEVAVRLVHAGVLTLRRSRVPWATAGAMVLMALVGAFFMYVLLDVDRARTLGLLGAKARFAGGGADWTGHLALTAQAVSVGGLVVFGTASIWLFGREFADRTATDLLALPTSRTAVVAAKLGLGLAWCPALTALPIGLVLGLGALLGRRDRAVVGAGGPHRIGTAGDCFTEQ